MKTEFQLGNQPHQILWQYGLNCYDHLYKYNFQNAYTPRVTKAIEALI